MKIVQIIPSFNVGGGELLAVRLSAEILRQNPLYEVYLISLYDASPSVVYEEAIESGAKIVTLHKKKGFDPSTLLGMSKVLRAIKPDVIHTHLGGFRYTVPCSLLLNNAVKIHTVHTIANHETSVVLRYFYKFAFNYLGWLPVALSGELKRSILDIYDINAPIVTNGVRINGGLRNIDRDLLRSKHGINENEVVVIAIGRLCEEKNHALLIDAFAQLCEKVDNARLLIVGKDSTNGSFTKMLGDKINAFPNKISSKINLLGQRKDIGELLLTSDIFVLSSNWEGVPLTLLEAMGYGIPIVSTSVGGIPDIVDHGIDGMLVPRQDKESLVQVMLDLLINKEKAANLSKKALAKFSNLYSIEITAKGYLDLYNRQSFQNETQK